MICDRAVLPPIILPCLPSPALKTLRPLLQDVSDLRSGTEIAIPHAIIEPDKVCSCWGPWESSEQCNPTLPQGCACIFPRLLPSVVSDRPKNLDIEGRIEGSLIDYYHRQINMPVASELRNASKITVRLVGLLPFLHLYDCAAVRRKTDHVCSSIRNMAAETEAGDVIGWCETLHQRSC